MSKGFDCATPLTVNLAKQFASDGFAFVCRYLASEGSWKRLTANEANIITNTGMYIVSVFERDTTNTLKGAKQGAEDGKLAFQYAQEVNQPLGTTIYAAVDTDVNSTQFDVIEQYMRAFADQIQGYVLGVYGERDVCEAMRSRGVAIRVWQTQAWSHGQVADNYNIYQNELGSSGLGIHVHGITVDLDDSNNDAGAWKVGMVVNQNIKEDEFDMDKILDYPDWAWAELDTYVGNAYNDGSVQDWYWVQRVRDKQLQYKELLLLKVLIDERRRTKK